MWTKESLTDLVRDRLKGYVFIVVSNREPYIHTFSENNIEVKVPPSGLTTALDPVMQACGGTWIAHGSGNADRQVVDKQNKVLVPPDEPSYSLKRVWLTKKQEEGYYSGFSNEALWPLCHIAYTRPIFKEEDWKIYKEVNQLFAENVLSEIGYKKAFVFIQDYHLALLPKLIKKRKNIISAQFWHIPWPNREAFRICPWREEILEGLLANDLLGFHIQYHCNNFFDTVDRGIEALVDWERYDIVRGGKKTKVRPFPISIDFEQINQDAQEKIVEIEVKRLKKELNIEDKLVGLGLDRIDYTKGIPDRLIAFDLFLEKYPEYKEKVVLIQAGVSSRTNISAYQSLNIEINTKVEDINCRHSSGSWKPVIYLNEHLSPTTLMALRRIANFCIVSSLHDGMNLVAKEYIASRFDEDGVLILSPFTGASRELTEALLINPFATDQMVEAIKLSLEMPLKERKKRMIKMRKTVQENNVYKWAADIISELVKFDTGD